MKNKIIAVWGNDGAGKSLISCALANKLTAKDTPVIVISTSKQTPMFRSYLPMTEEQPDFSLAKLLTDTVSGNALKSKINVHPSNGNLGFMSLTSGDNSLSYQSNWRLEAIQQTVDLIAQFELASYIIFDCGSDDILSDNGTLFALEHSSVVVRVGSPDNRSISFFAAAEPIMRGGSFRLDSHVTVLNNVYPYSPVTQMVKDWSYNYTLPHAPSVYKRYVAGQLLHKFDDTEGCCFDTTMNQLVERVVSRLAE